MEYADTKMIAERLEDTNFSAFDGQKGRAVDQIIENVKCIEAYLTECMIGAVHKRIYTRLELDAPADASDAAWEKAKVAIRQMNELCRTLGLPDYLPEEPKAARKLLAERRQAVLEASMK